MVLFFLHFMRAIQNSTAKTGSAHILFILRKKLKFLLQRCWEIMRSTEITWINFATIKNQKKRVRRQSEAQFNTSYSQNIISSPQEWGWRRNLCLFPLSSCIKALLQREVKQWRRGNLCFFLSSWKGTHTEGDLRRESLLLWTSHKKHNL